ncbi:hypothetical protein CMI37_14710 [Candidatus Pacearchaeota archaeon]|nr:hypothetical protein [Candidatus Pacearchaeota archaeon]|tara:strand:+ start:2611 stop:2976 length:366 start_codon:yes stop_codon:yes gene_type:complete
MDLRQLTEEYIKYFSQKNLSKIIQLFHSPECYLSDPDNVFYGAEEIEREICRLFEFDILFEPQSIHVCEASNTSFVEFKIQIDDIFLEGMDIIEWKSDKICALRAYVVPSNDKKIHGDKTT